MIIYLLKSASCLALLLFFYHLILEKEKMHNFNRFYLLLGVLFSFLAPLITFTTYIQPTVFVTENFTETPFMVEEIPMIVEETPFDYWQLAIGVYLLISLVFLIRFGFNLFKIIRKIRTHTQIKHLTAVLILVDDKILPHTFWNYIFINKKEYESGTIEQELFTHELTHVTQKHTFDVLFIELLQAVFWINPLFIFLKRAIQLNHEFLADQTVINTHKNTLQYQHLLLNKAAWNNEYYLASNLNYSLTKKRLKMMTTQSSKTKIWLKKLAVLPLLAGFVFLFAERVEAQEKQEVIETIVEQPYDTQKDLSESEVYKKYVYRNLTVKSKDKNGKQISKKYSELNEEEKARLIPPPPLKLRKILPTKQQFEALKDSKNYAVWIDGKVVKNEVLNNYKYTDFARYSSSHVYKNARSKRFPQENQARLSTHKYFEAENAIRVWKFQKYLKEEYKVEELENIEKIQEQKKKGISVREMKEYKKLTTKYKSKKIANKPTIFLEKDVQRMKYLYGKMNLNQQKKSLQIKDLTPLLPTIAKKKEYIDPPIIKNYPGSKQRIPSELPSIFNDIKPKNTNVGTIEDIRLKLKDINALKIKDLDSIPSNTSLIKYTIKFEDNNNRVITDIREKLKDINVLKIEYLDKDDSKNLKEVTPKEMEIYKTLLASGKKSNMYKQKDILKMQDIYKRMSIKQKNSVENVSELIPPPPPPKATSNNINYFNFPIKEKFNPKIISKFGKRTHPILKISKMHNGIDISADEKADITSIGKGKVVKISKNDSKYGKFVILEHGNGLKSFYAHMNSINVKKGQILNTGEKIGVIGNSGRVINTHLHFEILKNGTTVNPLEFFKIRK